MSVVIISTSWEIPSRHFFFRLTHRHSQGSYSSSLILMGESVVFCTVARSWSTANKCSLTLAFGRNCMRGRWGQLWTKSGSSGTTCNYSNGPLIYSFTWNVLLHWKIKTEWKNTQQFNFMLGGSSRFTCNYLFFLILRNLLHRSGWWTPL